MSLLTSEARFDGRPLRASASSALAIAFSDALTPSQRSGSGSHSLDLWLTHGRRVSSVSSPRMRSLRVRPARLVVATPSPTYAPAHAMPLAWSSPTELYQSR